MTGQQNVRKQLTHYNLYIYIMYFYIIKNLRLIVGWNPKVACTTVKTLLLRKLGHKVKGNVHHDMLSIDNLICGKYDIFWYIPKIINVDLNSYTKICFVRNPYERLISGIRQTSGLLCNYKKFGDLSENTINMFLQNLKKYNYIEHHFIPQVKNINDFKFDHVIDIKDMSKLYSILEFEHKIEKIGGHSTKYNDYYHDDKYYNLTLKDISIRSDNEWSGNIYSWFTKNDIKLINELYKDDFIFAKKNGYDYEIN